MACFILTTVLLTLWIYPVFSQEEATPARTIPDALRRPDMGEAPRYPQDLVIGELGQGQAPEGAYRFAMELISSLAAGNKSAPAFVNSLPLLSESLLEEISSLEIRSYRIGGGRVEADGNVSFLVRFLGPAESITGELFVHEAEEWRLDDLILEEKRALAETKDSYRYDFSPYERFF